MNKNPMLRQILKEIKFLCGFFPKYFMHYSSMRIRNTIKNHLYEKSLGIRTAEIYSYRDEQSKFKDGRGYEPAPYYALEKIVDYLDLRSDDVCIDIGCGKGRVVCFLASQQIKQVIGIELNRDLTNIAKGNLAKLRKRKDIPVEIINIDAADYDYKYCTVFFLFNPFGYRTLHLVLEKIKKSLVTNPRRITIIYDNPIYREFLDCQKWLVADSQIAKHNILTWHNKV